jgi:cytochrome c oxidase cbb3-type subunit III
MRASLLTTSAAACALILLLASCDPPGKPKANEAQAENREAILDFKTLFRSNCAGCHGLDGRLGPARILNDSLYLSLLPRETLRQIVIYGRPGTAMPAWAKSQGGPLTSKQVDALVDGIYTNWAKPATSAPDAPHYASTGTGDVNRGKILFVRSCFMCHVKGAAVGPISTPNYLELVSTQMLRTSIIVGRPDLGMPDYRHLKLGKALTDQDVTDLVAYLNSLRTSPAPGEVGAPAGGQQTTSTGPHETENGTGQSNPSAKGNEGSGNGPGSPRHQENEDKKGKSSSSQRGVK